MMNNGIVRRIDDLGRIVIPKEVRKEIGVEEGMPMEIIVNSDNTVTLKKYQMTSAELIAKLIDQAIDYLEQNGNTEDGGCYDAISKLNQALDKLDEIE